MERVLHDDWLIRLGENSSVQSLEHLPAMLSSATPKLFSRKISRRL